MSYQSDMAAIEARFQVASQAAEKRFGVRAAIAATKYLPSARSQTAAEQYAYDRACDRARDAHREEVAAAHAKAKAEAKIVNDWEAAESQAYYSSLPQEYWDEQSRLNSAGDTGPLGRP